MMNLSDNETVQKIIQVRKRLLNAIEDAEKFAEKANKDHDRCGVDENLSYGYWCDISEHKDGSGDGIRTMGCYVGVEVAEATKQVLKNKLAYCDGLLYKYGITIDVEDGE